MGLPFVTHSLLKGYNVDPVQLQALRQRQQEDAQRRLEFSQEQERLRESSLVDRMFREKAAKLQEDDSIFLRGLKGRELDEAIAARAESRKQAQADREQQASQFAAKQEQADQQLQLEREDAQRREREQGMRQQAIEQEQARETERTQDITNRAQVRTRSRAIIADRVQQIQQTSGELGGIAGSMGGSSAGMKPEQIRDLMLAETQGADLTPADRQEVQAAIAEWYQEALTAENNETSRAFNAAKLEDVDETRDIRREEGAAMRESRERVATTETERKQDADQERVKAQRLTLIDRKMARAEKRREDVFGTIQFYRGKEGTEEKVAGLEAELKKIDDEIAKLEAEESSVISGGPAKKTVNSEWGDMADARP